MWPNQNTWFTLVPLLPQSPDQNPTEYLNCKRREWSNTTERWTSVIEDLVMSLQKNLLVEVRVV